jgi:hypothetical protein
MAKWGRRIALLTNGFCFGMLAGYWYLERVPFGQVLAGHPSLSVVIVITGIAAVIWNHIEKRAQ